MIRVRRFCLYRHFSTTGELLYVGVSISVMERTNQHALFSPWFGLVTNIAVEHFQDRPSMMAAEALAIVNERPTHNISHSATRKVVRFSGIPVLEEPLSPDDNLITPSDAAELMGITKDWLYRARHGHWEGPPCYVVGKVLRYKEREVLSFIESRRGA